MVASKKLKHARGIQREFLPNRRLRKAPPVVAGVFLTRPSDIRYKPHSRLDDLFINLPSRIKLASRNMKTSNVDGKSVALPLVALFVVSAITAAQAQSTWVAGATNFTLWSKAGNWSPIGVPNSNSATAIFALPSKPNPVVDLIVNVGQIQFVPASPAYTITVNASQSLSLHGAGITNQSAFTQTFVNNGILNFDSAATAGNNVSITNNSIVNFVDSSSAGNSTITTNSGGGLFLKIGCQGSECSSNYKRRCSHRHQPTIWPGNHFWLDCRCW
jgi:hypothetical protein